MALKRSSRVFADESTHTEEDRSSRSSASSFSSRRDSRSSSRDEFLKVARDVEEGARAKSAPTAARDLSKETSKNSLTRVAEAEAKEMIPEPTTLDGMGFPSAPLQGRPTNFGVIVPGVYRSGYPKAEDYTYLKSLQLRTMVTLVKKDGMDEELSQFVSTNGINQLIFNMKGTRKEAIPTSTMTAILEVVLDSRNYPLILHCNHGKHRTGCVVAAVRKTAGWALDEVLDEYRSFAEPKIRDCDVDYITSFQTSSHLVPTSSIAAAETNHRTAHFTPVQIRAFSRALMVSGLLMAVWMLSGCHMMAIPETSPP